MTFDIRKLVLLDGVRGETAQVWSYTTDDHVFDVSLFGYFNAARTLLQPGDTINVSYKVSGLPAAAQLCVTQLDSDGVMTHAAKPEPEE